MNSFLLLSILSLLSYSSSLPCDYFDPNIQPNNCDVILSQFNHSDINQVELENLKSYITSSNINSFQLLHKNHLIISLATAPIDSTISLSQPFLLSLSSILFSDSSHYSYPPFSSIISRLTPGVQIDVPLDTYLFDILSLQVFDHMNDRYWYGRT
ncbi:hypothetical protein LOD99_7000 [Oopsacas minuta]|uniref:Uncharacterized protein n=1 Tax=Oopsacas minuta TaxID=111878 RepID=A0AAV7JJG1_9METZ|nr:hypothetical protein LOD99_7000 [Oopsacas minuta]